MIIDLHGYHIHNAWKHFNNEITNAYFQGYKKCIVITGQGLMMHEVTQWAYHHVYVRECKQHERNPGSFTVKLKKRPNITQGERL